MGCFVFHKKFSLAVKPCVNYRFSRVTAMEINSSASKIILINAYMPFLNSSKLNECKIEYLETLSHIQRIIYDFPGYEVIICSDLNCNVYDGRNSFSKMLREFIAKNHLITALDLNTNIDISTAWTRQDFKKKSSLTLIDGILISRNLVQMVDCIDIGHYGTNLSDHCPVEMRIRLDIVTFTPRESIKKRGVNWRLVTGAVREKYESTMDALLRDISVNIHEMSR